jgi:hypothetical protein
MATIGSAYTVHGGPVGVGVTVGVVDAAVTVGVGGGVHPPPGNPPPNNKYPAITITRIPATARKRVSGLCLFERGVPHWGHRPCQSPYSHPHFRHITI